jgi:hypothetical protein
VKKFSKALWLTGLVLAWFCAAGISHDHKPVAATRQKVDASSVVNAFHTKHHFCEISSGQGVAAVQGNNRSQNLAVYLGTHEQHVTRSIPSVSVQRGCPRAAAVKRYLAHIYPSHNFW